MRNAVCSHCHATLPAPDADRCPRCGQSLAPPETHITRHPSAAQAIRADAQPEYHPSPSPPAPEPPRGCYANWADFRANSPVVQRTLLDLATRVLPDMRAMPREQLPVDLPPAADGLGVPVASVALAQDGTSAARVLVQRIVGWAALCCALAAMLLLQQHRFARIGVWLAVAPVVVVLFLRLGRLWRLRVLQSVHLWVFEHGILWQDGATLEACRFEDIEGFRVMRAIPQPYFMLVPRRGVTLRLNLSSTVAVLPLAEYIELRMASARLLPTLERIVAGERVRLGAVTLDAHGFTGPGISAAWPQLVRVMGDDRMVYVECRDQPGWRSVRAGDVSCPMLMLAIAHILTEEAPRLPALSR